MNKNLPSSGIMLSLLIFLSVGFMCIFSYAVVPDKVGMTVIISFLSAFIGAIITMGITQYQLQHQSKTGLAREKSSKVFEERLQVFKEYLNILNKVLSKNEPKLTVDDKMQLAFATSMIALHTNGENLQKISEKIAKIIKEKQNNPPTEISTQLIDDLLVIVESLKAQLYGNDSNKEVEINEAYAIKIRENFNDAYDIEALADDTINQESITAVSPSMKNTYEDRINIVLPAWDKAVAKWRSEGWDVCEGWIKDPKNQWFSIIRKDGKQGEISTAIRQGIPCIKVTYGNSTDFSYDMKIHPPKGIRTSDRRGGTWWTSDGLLCHLEDNKVAENMSENIELQHFIIDLIEDVQQRILAFHNN